MRNITDPAAMKIFQAFNWKNRRDIRTRYRRFATHTVGICEERKMIDLEVIAACGISPSLFLISSDIANTIRLKAVSAIKYCTTHAQTL